MVAPRIDDAQMRRRLMILAFILTFLLSDSCHLFTVRTVSSVESNLAGSSVDSSVAVAPSPNPSVVGTSASPRASMGGKTHTHWDGSRYWAFYYDGSNYLAKSSPDGSSWTTAPITLVSSPSKPYVAVASSGSSIHMAYGSYASRTSSGPLTVQMHYRRALINNGTSITLEPEQTLFTWTQTCASISEGGSFRLDIRHWDIAIGTDGLITVTWSRNGYFNSGGPDPFLASRYVYNVIRSTTTDGSTWGSIVIIESSDSFWNGDTFEVSGGASGTTAHYDVNTRPLLAPMASGFILCVENKDGEGRYRMSTDWITAIDSFDRKIRDVDDRGSLAWKDAPSGSSGLAYIDSDDTVDVWWYDGTNTRMDLNVFPAVSFSPTFTMKNNTDGAWYLAVIRGAAIEYRRFNRAARIWDVSATLATTQTSPAHLSSPRTVLNNRVLFFWQTGSSPPYNIVFNPLHFSPRNDALTVDLKDAKHKGSKTLLAGKQDYKFLYRSSHPDGVTEITYAEITLDYPDKKVVLRVTRTSNDSWTFHEQNDPNNYVALNKELCTHSTECIQKTFIFLVRINWNWADSNETVGVRAYVVDSNLNDRTDDYTNMFGIVSRLTFTNLKHWLEWGPSFTLTAAFSGTLVYEGTSIAPPDGNYNVKAKLSGVQKGSTNMSLARGSFTIYAPHESILSAIYSYTVECDHMARPGRFNPFILDVIRVYVSYAVSVRAITFYLLIVSLLIIALRFKWIQLAPKISIRPIPEYLKENPGSPLILAFILSLILAATIYPRNATLANDIITHTFLLLIAGVILQIITLARKGPEEDPANERH